MPSTSKKQHRLMAAVAHSPEFAKKVGIKQSVGKEFLEADKGKKFGTGGDVNYTYGGKGQINKQRTRGGSIFGYEKNVPNANLDKYIGKKEGGIVAKMKHDDVAEDKKLIKKAFGMHDKQLHEKKRTDLSKLCGGGKVKKMAAGGKARGSDVKIAMMGGDAPRRPAPVPAQAAAQAAQRMAPAVAPRPAMPGAPVMKKGGCVKKSAGGLASGHKSADGIATKGKTKGRTVTMAAGGTAKKKYC